MNEQQEKETRRSAVQHWQIITVLLVLFDAVAVNAAYFLALWFRFDCRVLNIHEYYLSAWARFTPVYAVFCLLVFALLKMYRSIWRFASFTELSRIAVASLITAVFHTAAITIFVLRMPMSYYVMGPVLQFVLVTGVRFSYRFLLLLREAAGRNSGVCPVMMIGAGNAGQLLLRDLQHDRHTEDRIVCIIDDSPNAWGRYLDGVPIVGGRECILESVEKYKIRKIFFAIPSASPEVRRDILNICQETGCELKSLPGLSQLARGEVTVNRMRDVSIEDLLGRDPIRPDLREVFEFINGKRVLVTGGGGSIGSELCRQIAAHGPEQLIIFDIYENNAYEIQNELRDRYPELNLVTLIGSVRDSRRLLDVFSRYRPQIVYHAAAHKHVPLMEFSPCEAIKNNVFGTYKTAWAALHCGCERFVLISTDKAVNPTNVMGASKRLCEMVVQAFDARIREGRAADIPLLSAHALTVPELPAEGLRTEFVAVRFGNVLGSNGSVVPLFRKQIERGGPVTVTHPDIIRYFMTVPEAVSLVMLAGTYAQGGEIFVLDMGTPVKIETLARNLIRLSGFKPDVDIRIEYSGLRPGEKLYEEKLMAEEGLRKTDNELIHIGNPIPFDTDAFLKALEGLQQAAFRNDPDIRTVVAAMVSTYKYQA